VTSSVSLDEAQLALGLAPDLLAVRSQWNALAERSGNLFSTWEWAYVWWRHFGTGGRPLPIVCRDEGGKVVAILPLYLYARRPIRIARFMGHGVADQLGPVCEPENIRAAEALARSGRDGPLRWDLLLAERLPAGGAWERSLGGRALNHESSPIVNIEGLSWEAYLASRSPNFCSQLRRKERKLVREHGLVYRLGDDPERLREDMETLFSLHHARWQAESVALAGRRTAFHHEFAELALQRGWLRLWLAQVRGRTVAAWYGFRFAGAEWYYQAGRDPAWDRSSIGLVLLAHTLREAINDGIREYKLLRGGEAFKFRFASGDLPVVSVAVPRGALGHAAAGAGAAALSLPRWARRAVTRAVGN
jgi:CelD/BcsL family acetyltransferase involved in cellulose biosynthesis